MASQESLDRADGDRGRREEGDMLQDDAGQPSRVGGRGVEGIPRNLGDDHGGGGEGGGGVYVLQ